MVQLWRTDDPRATVGSATSLRHYQSQQGVPNFADRKRCRQPTAERREGESSLHKNRVAAVCLLSAAAAAVASQAVVAAGVSSQPHSNGRRGPADRLSR